MDITLFAGVIGASGAVLGSIVGGVISARATEKATKRSVEAQERQFAEERTVKKEEEFRILKANAILVHYQILNFCYEGFIINSNIGDKPNGKNVVLPTMYIDSEKLSHINKILEPNEFIKIYRLFGYMEKVREDILNYDVNTGNFKHIRINFRNLLLELFTLEKYKDILNYDVNRITHDYIEEFYIPEYKDIFKKLKNI